MSALTRAAWNARANALLREPEYDHGWALLIVDVDRFADLNSTHGRLAADQVLGAVVAMFHEIVGTNGVVGRWGGDEFVILLPAASSADARRHAEDIGQAVAGLVVMVDRPQGAVTITGVTASIGVTFAQASDLTSALWTADAALYAAKRAGGNTTRST